MTALGELVTPKSLFAASAMIHRGVGGLTCCFSNIGWALPLQMTTVPATDKQTAPVGTAVPLDPAVLVEFLHPTIAPAPGIDVTFGPVNGTVSATLVTTGVDGIAATHWTLATTPGTNLLVASAPANGSPQTFSATGTAPVTLTLDQANDPETGLSFGCGADGSLYQSFTPRLSPLGRVELRMRAGGSFPAVGTSTTILIHAGGPTGTVLGTATAAVAGPQATGAQLLVPFDFSSTIALTVGQPYVIEWPSTLDAVLTWMGTTTDVYAGGTAFGCGGSAVLGNDDLNFNTYAATVGTP